MTSKKASYANTANTIIKKLAPRGINGFYCEDSESAKKMVMEMMPEGSSVTWGGSETVYRMGILDAVKNGNYTAVDRYAKADTPEEIKALKASIYTADYYLMSSNAITVDGELINIDGNGNRVACLINGPDKVIMVIGMNKVVRTVEDGINRVHTIAAPPNGTRIGSGTPCEVTGVCSECKGSKSMCCHTVITRSSRHEGRINVILVGEELGY